MLFADLEINEKNSPTKKDPNRKIFVISNELFANWLGLKGREVNRKDRRKLEKLRDDYVIDQCCVLKRERKKFLKKN